MTNGPALVILPARSRLVKRYSSPVAHLLPLELRQKVGARLGGNAPPSLDQRILRSSLRAREAQGLQPKCSLGDDHRRTARTLGNVSAEKAPLESTCGQWWMTHSGTENPCVRFAPL